MMDSLLKCGRRCLALACLALAALQPAAADDLAAPAAPSAAEAQALKQLSPRLAPSVSPEMDEYQIGPHDLLEISVLHVPEATRTVRVNAQGFINLPLLGNLRAGGLTAGELEVILAARLSKDFLKDPQVNVFVKEAVSHRVLVEGSVVKLGVYPLAGKMTLMQVVAMAGGVAPLADTSNVRIFRHQPNGTREVMTFDLAAIQDGTAEDPVIKSNDVVIVGKSASATFVKTFLDSIRGFVTLGTIPLIGW